MNKLFYLCVGLAFVFGWTVAEASSSRLRRLPNQPDDGVTNSEATYDEAAAIRREFRPRHLKRKKGMKKNKDIKGSKFKESLTKKGVIQGDSEGILLTPPSNMTTIQESETNPSQGKGKQKLNIKKVKETLRKHPKLQNEPEENDYPAVTASATSTTPMTGEFSPVQTPIQEPIYPPPTPVAAPTTAPPSVSVPTTTAPPPPVAAPTAAPPAPAAVPTTTAPPPQGGSVSSPTTASPPSSPVAVSLPTTTTVRQTVCGMEGPILLGSSGMGGLYRNDVLFFGGLLIGTIPTNVTELVVDLTTNRAWIQVGEGSFTLLEIDPYSGAEIEDTRFSTLAVNQFQALEIIEGVLYGAGGGGSTTSTTSSSSSSSSFYRIDPDAGIWEEIGPTGLLGPLSGLAWTGTTLYATSGGGGSSELYTINLQTGAATIVCAALPQGFESLVYYPQTGDLYGGTSDGYISEIDPINCLTKYSTWYSNWWNAGYSPITGLAMVCPQVL
jgi:hypothetical protein